MTQSDRLGRLQQGVDLLIDLELGRLRRERAAIIRERDAVQKEIDDLECQPRRRPAPGGGWFYPFEAEIWKSS